jgi:PIN domain nuclease of toxin-antitoxin system
VKALLDTNVFLWCIAGRQSRLSRRAAKVLEDPHTELLLSTVSLWEIDLKVRAGKLELPEQQAFFDEHMNLLGIQAVLPVRQEHIFGLFSLPDHHRDPFDRLLVSQCIAEKIPLIASDAALRKYSVDLLW